jgi:hypothetical protein
MLLLVWGKKQSTSAQVPKQFRSEVRFSSRSRGPYTCSVIIPVPSPALRFRGWPMLSCDTAVDMAVAVAVTVAGVN